MAAREHDPSIWDFMEVRAYLRAWRAAGGLRRSFTKLAQRLNTAPGFVHSMLQDVGPKRARIEGAWCDRWVDVIGLTGAEEDYFRALVTSAEGATERQRVEGLQEAARLRRQHRVTPLSPDDLPLIATWYYAAILSLAKLASFRADPEWIAAALRPTISPEEAQQALDFLIDRGHLVQVEGGWRARGGDTVIDPGGDIERHREAMRALYSWFIERAPAAMQAFQPEERAFGAFLGVVPVSRHAEATAIIQEAQSRILALEDPSAPGDHRAYAMTIQLFPMSEPLRGGPR